MVDNTRYAFAWLAYVHNMVDCVYTTFILKHTSYFRLPWEDRKKISNRKNSKYGRSNVNQIHLTRSKLGLRLMFGDV